MKDLRYLLDRKSVRSFEDKKISLDIKNELLNATLRALTAGNMMMYSIIEIDNQELKNKLSVTCDNQAFIGKAPLVLLFLADFQRWMDYLKASGVEEYNKENNLKMYKPSEGDLMLAINDALIAAQNAVVAGEILGLGSCYIGDIMENYEIHKELLNLPKYTFPITMLCFGYPTEQQKNRVKTERYPKELIVFKDKYRSISNQEFDELNKKQGNNENNRYLPGCKNEAIHMYKRKITSDFMAEMTRSVKAALANWLD
ncbi:MAG: nitroreductase family protein [Fusobacteriaceae bacterium]